MKLQIVWYHFLFTERNCQTSNAYYVYVVDTDALQHYKIIFFILHENAQDCIMVQK